MTRCGRRSGPWRRPTRCCWIEFGGPGRSWKSGRLGPPDNDLHYSVESLLTRTLERLGRLLLARQRSAVVEARADECPRAGKRLLRPLAQPIQLHEEVDDLIPRLREVVADSRP